MTRTVASRLPVACCSVTLTAGEAASPFVMVRAVKTITSGSGQYQALSEETLDPPCTSKLLEVELVATSSAAFSGALEFEHFSSCQRGLQMLHIPRAMRAVAQTALSAVSPAASWLRPASAQRPGFQGNAPPPRRPAQVGNLRNSRLGSLRYEAEVRLL